LKPGPPKPAPILTPRPLPPPVLSILSDFSNLFTNPGFRSIQTAPAIPTEIWTQSLTPEPTPIASCTDGECGPPGEPGEGDPPGEPQGGDDGGGESCVPTDPGPGDPFIKLVKRVFRLGKRVEPVC
jgi:hypothetical protein